MPQRATTELAPRLATSTGARSIQLRVGALLDSRVAEGWVIEALRRAVAEADVLVAAVVVVRSTARPSAPATVHTIIDSAERALRCANEPLLARIDAATALAPNDCFDVSVKLHGNGWTPDGA